METFLTVANFQRWWPF